MKAEKTYLRPKHQENNWPLCFTDYEIARNAKKIYTKPIRPESSVLASLKWPISCITTLKAYDPNEGICICWLYGVDLLERMTFYEFIRWKQNEHVCGERKKAYEILHFLVLSNKFLASKGIYSIIILWFPLNITFTFV